MDHLVTRPPGPPPPPNLAAAQNRDAGLVIVNLGDAKSKSKVKPDTSKGMVAWMASGRSKEKKRKRKSYAKDSVDPLFAAEENKNSRPASSIEREENRRRQTFFQQDPLNIHQAILKNLQGSARAPITSVYGLAKLITSSCTDVFDQYKIPPDFQFFDFFERSIGAVVSKVLGNAESNSFL